MLRQGHRGVMIDGVMVPTKIRKRGCSSTSSSSSKVYNYRLNKRAILVGKNRVGFGVGGGRSRSSTPVPTWRTAALRGAVDSPKYSQSGKSTRPVSARKLAATLWEMNEMPSPEMSEGNSEVVNRRRQQKKSGSRIVSRLQSGSGYLPPHLSDPSHSPTVSEKMDRSGTGSRQRRRTPSISQMLMYADRNVGVHDSISNASFMEVETRSRPQTSSGSVINSRNRLKDISNALTTSKELLKIITRNWAHANQPSSSLSLVSALHAELERARLHVNHLIQEPRSDNSNNNNEINYLTKRFAEEKASWKIKEKQSIEAAVGSVAVELEAERKLRRRVESLNKKLGMELAETKSSFIEVVKELESEKRAREMTERVCDELARSIDEDRAEVEKEREMLQLADKLREERVQMKLSEARHQFEEKNSAVCKLRKQLEVFLGTRNKQEDDDDDDDGDIEDSSAESELHSIELNTNKDNKNNNNKGYKRTPLQRSVSDGVERGFRGDSFEREEFRELEKEASRSGGYIDEAQGVNKSVKGSKDRMLSSSRFASSSNQKEQSWPSRDPCGGTLEERSSLVQTTSSKSRTGVVRRSKR